MRTGIGHAGEVEDALEGAVLAGPTVTGVHHHIDVDGFAPPEPATGGEPAFSDHQPEGLRPSGHAIEEGRGLQGGVDSKPLRRLRPVQPGHGSTGSDQLSGRLQTGQHAHVVLGRGAAEADGDPGGGGWHGGQG